MGFPACFVIADESKVTSISAGALLLYYETTTSKPTDGLSPVNMDSYTGSSFSQFTTSAPACITARQYFL